MAVDDTMLEKTGDEPLIQEAQEFLNLCTTADTMNRSEAIEDLKFSAGEQWPVEIQNSRTLESRPCLTINKVDAYCRQIVNNIRQQRPRIKVHGVNNEADAKMAEVWQGICRHIEVNSDADQAYDTAVDHAVRMGWGYLRITTDYIREDSFDQEIYIKPIHNPFTVYFDPNSTSPDGADAERALITEVIDKKVFAEMYPDADQGVGFTQRGSGDSNAEWVNKEDIRIAEYFYTVRKDTELIVLANGETGYIEDYDGDPEYIIKRRKTVKKEIRWAKLTGMQVLEEGVWPGRFIPIIPVYGHRIVIENKHKKFGIVRQARDPQRMFNFWTTALTESIALAPKPKWLLAEGQDEGHENESAQANIKSAPVLRYKQKDIEGVPAPVPSRIQPEAPPAGIMAAMDNINADLQAVIGIFDPSQLPQGNISGKALNGQQQQVDLTNYHFYDNLTRSIRHIGKIILDLGPKIYDTERVMRIIGMDGQPDMVTLNQQGADEEGIYKTMNDTSVGEYDVVMDTGPGYNSKRQEAIEAMIPLMTADPALMQVAGDLFFRNMDFPGAEIIADRLAAANPMSQIDEKSKIPPQVQMQLAMSKKQIEEMGQQLQNLQMVIKQRQDIESVKQDAETKRELMRQTAKAHNTESVLEARVHDVNMRAVTSQNKTEIESIMELLLHHMDTARLEKEIKSRNAEQYAYANESVSGLQPGIQ